MTSRLPFAVLALTVTTACVIAFGGLRLARQESVEVLPRDRAPIDAFAARALAELRRLEDVYSDHIEALAGSVGTASHLEVRSRSEDVWGVKQVSYLPLEGRAFYHEALGDGVFLPVPVFREQDVAVGRTPWVLDASQMGIMVPGESGWLEQSERTLAFWQSHLDSRVAVILIDRAEVVERINAWLGDWIDEPFAPLLEAGGADIFGGPTGPLALSGALPDRAADLEIPLSTRFGEWRLRSWNSRQNVVSYDRRTIWVAFALAAAVLFAGGFTIRQLRRALRLAEQRVSFVNRVSHELRTPLTNILLNADLAAEGATPVAAKRLGLVHEEAGRLSRLIENVLTFSRLTHREPDDASGAEPEASHGDIRTLVDEVLAQFSTALGRKGIKSAATVSKGVSDSTPLVAVADRDAVAQILGNLVSNVEKYAASGGRLDMEIDLTTARDEVVVRVADLGPGIPRHQQERIFKPFERLDDRVSEGSSGTGLGLAIARDLAEAEGGSLRLLESAGGVGATFELRLPAIGESEKVIEFPESRAS